MFNLKKRLLEKNQSDTATQVQDEFDRIQIATCVLLLEVARSDDEFNSIEQTTLQAILKKELQIPSEAIEALIEVASRSREKSVDLWEFTNLINEHYSREEKMKVIESVWKIIYADNKLDRYEDHLVHKLAKLLWIRHDEMIEIKLRVRYGESDS